MNPNKNYLLRQALEHFRFSRNLKFPLIQMIQSNKIGGGGGGSSKQTFPPREAPRRWR